VVERDEGTFVRDLADEGLAGEPVPIAEHRLVPSGIPEEPHDQAATAPFREFHECHASWTSMCPDRYREPTIEMRE
jgi:hypothetical protein